MLKRKNGRGGAPGLRADFQTLLQRAGLVGEDAEVFVLGGHGGRIVGQSRDGERENSSLESVEEVRMEYNVGGQVGNWRD